MFFKAIVDDARQTLANGNSSPWAYGSGELKMGSIAHCFFIITPTSSLYDKNAIKMDVNSQIIRPSFKLFVQSVMP